MNATADILTMGDNINNKDRRSRIFNGLVTERSDMSIKNKLVPDDDHDRMNEAEADNNCTHWYTGDNGEEYVVGNDDNDEEEEIDDYPFYQSEISDVPSLMSETSSCSSVTVAFSQEGEEEEDDDILRMVEDNVMCPSLSVHNKTDGLFKVPKNTSRENNRTKNKKRQRSCQLCTDNKKSISSSSSSFSKEESTLARYMVQDECQVVLSHANDNDVDESTLCTCKENPKNILHRLKRQATNTTTFLENLKQTRPDMDKKVMHEQARKLFCSRHPTKKSYRRGLCVSCYRNMTLTKRRPK